MIDRNYISKTGDIGGHSLLADVSPLVLVRPLEKVLVEDASGKRNVLRCTGRWQNGNVINANGRLYETSILESAVKSIQGDIKARGVLGEYDHPPDAKIHLDRVSHIITKLWTQDNEVYGELEVLEHLPYGQQLAGLLKSNVRVGISSRGVGDMESTYCEGREVMKVLPGYSFVTFDVVAEPSVHGSYLHLMESKQRQLNTRRELEKKFISEFRNRYK